MTDEVVSVDFAGHNAVPDPRIGIAGVEEFVSRVKNAFPIFSSILRTKFREGKNRYLNGTQ